MIWTQLPNGAYVAQGDWMWELEPMPADDLWPDRHDVWRLRGRRDSSQQWRYFGAYQTLDGAKAWAEKEDSYPPGHALFRRRPVDPDGY